jgi:DNA polymerase III subunit epsilon
VRPDGWSMTPGATAVNGLTDEILAEKGVPVTEVLAAYSEAISEGRAVVAFNAQHDCKTMRAELRRAGMPDLFEQTQNFCAMRKAAGVIPKAGGKKGWPKLSEACAFLKIEQPDAHTALADARSAATIFRYLREQGVDITPEVHYAKKTPESKLAAEGSSNE